MRQNQPLLPLKSGCSAACRDAKPHAWGGSSRVSCAASCLLWCCCGVLPAHHCTGICEVCNYILLIVVYFVYQVVYSFTCTYDVYYSGCDWLKLNYNTFFLAAIMEDDYAGTGKNNASRAALTAVSVVEILQGATSAYW